MGAAPLSLLSIAVVPVWHLHGTLTARAMPRVLRGIMFAGTSVAVVMLVLGLYLAFGQDPAIPKTSFISQIADWRLNGFAVGMLMEHGLRAPVLSAVLYINAIFGVTFNAVTSALTGRVAENPKATADLHRILDLACTHA